MAKYNIHQRKSNLDKNTKIVNVTKEKSLSEEKSLDWPPIFKKGIV